VCVCVCCVCVCVCVCVDSGIQHAMRVLRIIVRGLPEFTKCFHIVPLTARFSKKVTKPEMCFFIFSTVLSGTFLILRRIGLDIIIMYTILHVSSRYSCHMLMNLEYFDRILKSTQMSNFMTLLPVWTDRHGGTHMT